jgi:hypothetical protein
MKVKQIRRMGTAVFVSSASKGPENTIFAVDQAIQNEADGVGLNEYKCWMLSVYRR